MCLDCPFLSEELLEQPHLLSDLHSVEVSLTVEEGWTEAPVDVLRYLSLYLVGTVLVGLQQLPGGC